MPGGSRPIDIFGSEPNWDSRDQRSKEGVGDSTSRRAGAKWKGLALKWLVIGPFLPQSFQLALLPPLLPPPPPPPPIYSLQNMLVLGQS